MYMGRLVSPTLQIAIMAQWQIEYHELVYSYRDLDFW
jgi:hypothetical protein